MDTQYVQGLCIDVAIVMVLNEHLADFYFIILSLPLHFHDRNITIEEERRENELKCLLSNSPAIASWKGAQLL